MDLGLTGVSQSAAQSGNGRKRPALGPPEQQLSKDTSTQQLLLLLVKLCLSVAQQTRALKAILLECMKIRASHPLALAAAANRPAARFFVLGDECMREGEWFVVG